MKRVALLGAAFGIAGFILGVAFIQNALVEPLDVLAIPYRNEPSVTTQSLQLRVESTGASFVLPEGTPLIYRYDAEGQPHLAILVAGEPDRQLPLREVDAAETVYIQASGQ